jgi:hypothetical protein
VDTTIEVIYYFFPQEKYNSALTAEEEEQLFLQTSSQKKKLMLDSTLFDIKTGVSLPWLLKKSLRFFSLKSLSNEQKKSFSRVVKLNSPLLTQTGFFKNQNLILRLSKSFRTLIVVFMFYKNYLPTGGPQLLFLSKQVLVFLNQFLLFTTHRCRLTLNYQPSGLIFRFYLKFFAWLFFLLYVFGLFYYLLFYHSPPFGNFFAN